MREPVVDDVVVLTSDLPELSLHRGQSGVVRSLWFTPKVAYEVEFNTIGLDEVTRAEVTRAVLQRDQLLLLADRDGQFPPSREPAPTDGYELGIW